MVAVEEEVIKDKIWSSGPTHCERGAFVQGADWAYEWCRATMDIMAQHVDCVKEKYPNIDSERRQYKYKCQKQQAIIDRLKEALEFYKDLPMSEQDQLWTQELADKCIDVAKQALSDAERMSDE